MNSNLKHLNFTRCFFYGVNIKGIISRIESKDYYVLFADGKSIRCYLRGKFKKEFGYKRGKTYILDVAAVGDSVEVDINKDGSGIITKIYPRKNFISRKAPRIKGSSFRGERLEQIIAANIDLVFVVASVYEPLFNNKQVDRFIVIAESAGIQPILIVNKADLGIHSIENFIDLYQRIGYDIIPTSTVSDLNIDLIKGKILNKTSMFFGVSGVGKSSLINKAFPGLNLRVNEVSKSTNKGKHTTVTSQLIKLNENSFIIDTPGIREVEPFGIQKKDLSHFFIEFKEYLYDCKFSTCTHYHEPDCGVINAVKRGLISAERYESYLNMLNSIEEDILF